MDMSHAATCLATLRKVEDSSTFLATCNATFCCRCSLQKWGVTREIFLATCLATFVARQVAGKIASCNMALSIACHFGQTGMRLGPAADGYCNFPLGTRGKGNDFHFCNGGGGGGDGEKGGGGGGAGLRLI